MENKELIVQIRQRLEILYQMFEQLEQGGGGSPSDAYTKAQTDALLNGKVDKVAGSSLMTTAQANKLAGIQSGAEVNVQADWDQTDTTADDFIKNKPVIPDTSDFYTKSEIDSELSGKVDKQTGYSLISNANITKLNGIAAGAEVNVQANWNETNVAADSYIRNKPTIPDLTNYYNKTETTAQIQGAIADLDVSQTASTGHYIDYIAQENGLIIPHSRLSSTVPTTSDTTLITSGGVKAALGDFYNKTEVDNKDGAVVDNDGVKNLLILNPPSTSSGGVTLAVNSDGTITTTGSTTSTYAAFILNNNVVLPAGDYILSGCPSGGGDATYRIDISGTQSYDTGSGVQFTSTGAAITVRIRIGANIDVNNFVWKPMIRKADIANGDFVSYAPNNHELWEMIKALQPTVNNSLRTLNSQEKVEEEVIEERDDTNGDNR